MFDCFLADLLKLAEKAIENLTIFSGDSIARAYFCSKDDLTINNIELNYCLF